MMSRICFALIAAVLSKTAAKGTSNKLVRKETQRHVNIRSSGIAVASTDLGGSLIDIEPTAADLLTYQSPRHQATHADPAGASLTQAAEPHADHKDFDRFVRINDFYNQLEKDELAQPNRTWLEKENMALAAGHRNSTLGLGDGSVLFVVKTYSGYFNTRLRAVMQTWGSLVDKTNLLIVSDVGNSFDKPPPADWPVYKAPECMSDGGYGLACRTAHALELASKHPGDWSWVFLVDDDHYIHTEVVTGALAQLDVSKKMAAGSWGCGKDNYCDGLGGFCGGCGYGFNRAALKAMIGGSVKEFRAAFDTIAWSSSLSDGREDMAASCTAHKRVPDLKIQKVGTMAAIEWGPVVNGSHIISERQIKDGLGFLGWHHISPEQMVRLHAVRTQLLGLPAPRP